MFKYTLEYFHIRPMENKIKYWSKHQELDKFNYNYIIVLYLSLIVIVSSIIIPIMIYFGNNGSLGYLIITSLIFISTFLILLIAMNFKSKKHDASFMIREAMLRIWYQSLGVDTDLLDKQFEEIKKEFKKGISTNKQLELIAKEVINESSKKEK